jgi:transposase
MHSYFVGLDVHKQVIAYCTKTAAGEIVDEAKIEARPGALDRWLSTLPAGCLLGMETTMFSHWIYRHLTGRGAEVLMGHAAGMKAITAGKKKSDKIDARTIADLLRCNLFPTCHVIAPELEGLRRQLRFRRLVIQEQVTFCNKTAGLLMEHGIEYERRRLHGKRYFNQLMADTNWINEQMRPLLQFSRKQIETLGEMEKRLMRMLEKKPELRERVQALQTIDGVGPVTALTWALETGTPKRFPSMKDAQSYCGLTAAFRESAGQQKRGPLSKQRNPHLQSVLIETAKLAPMHNETLRAVYEKSKAAGNNHNQASLEVARKLVRYLLAVDRAFFAKRSAAVAA